MRHATPYFGSNQFSESFLAVDLFFVLSGFVIANAYSEKLIKGLSTFKFIQTRYIRLYPLYLFGIVLGLLNALMFADNHPQLIKELVFALLMLPSIVGSGPYPLNEPAWSLFPEIIVNALFAITVLTLTNAKLAIFVITASLGIIFIVFFTPGHTLDIGWTRSTFYAGFLRVIYSFPIGVLIYRLSPYVKNAKWRGTTGNLLTVVMLCLVGASLIANVPTSFRPFYEIFTVLIFFPMIVLMAVAIEPSGLLAKWSEFLGITSYAVYVTHSPLAELFEHIFKASGIAVSTYAPWSGFIFLAAIVLFCSILDRFYDWPCRRALLTLQRKWSLIGDKPHNTKSPSY